MVMHSYIGMYVVKNLHYIVYNVCNYAYVATYVYHTCVANKLLKHMYSYEST